MKKDDLHSVFRAILEGGESPKLINQLIKYSVRIALAHIKTKYGSEVRYNTNVNMNSLALEAITPLFIKATNGKLSIVNSAEAWDSEIESMSELDFFLHRIIWSRVSQTIFNYYKQNDPFFNKIIKSINYHAGKLGLEKYTHFGTVYLVEKDFISGDEIFIPDEEFYSLPSNLFCEKFSKVLPTLFKYLRKETVYLPAVPLNLLVKKIKSVSEIDIVSTDEEFNFKTKSEVDTVTDILNKCRYKLNEKIEKTYIRKNKLTIEEAEKLKKSFEFILEDMRNGGLSNGLYSYLLETDKTITSQEFYDKYHKIMNYLLKELKKNILSELNR